MVIEVGASCAKLTALANELLAACLQAESGTGTPGPVEVTIYAEENGPGGEVTIQITNDDMENRDDLDPDLVLVEVSD